MTGQIDLSQLNSPQREAVECVEGPLLVLAGAGSGKTRVLTYRVAYLIGHCGVRPWNIMAITFTNKAADEMRERVDALVGAGAADVWVSTFHSSCARILRRFIDRIGYARNFTIYDTDDSRQVVKEIIKRLSLNPKVFKERALLSVISAAKNELIGPAEFEKEAAGAYEEQAAEVYRLYQETLKSNNALDFDDLLVKTVELFTKDEDALDYCQERFRYIMIDEYQDTNTAQFEFVRLLASRYQNICVVGDDDQSIYKFRGANIRNILSFEEHFPGAKVIRLEQNYRSTQTILDAANDVIANNRERKEKRLWTDRGAGEKICFRQFGTAYEEADFVVDQIKRGIRNEGLPCRSFAVLYRTNAQSRLFEERCIQAGIPYKIVGGVNFYARREIKDILAYLKTIDNGLDDLACRRIINVPKRGIGQTTVERIAAYAEEHGMSLFDAMQEAERIDGAGRAKDKIAAFVMMILRYRAMANEISVRELTELILKESGYRAELEEEGTPEAEARIENLDEFLSKAEGYHAQAEEPSLSEFLQQVSLVADIDTVDENSDYVLLMTMHAAKGLEFPRVFLAGMEDGLFPGYLAISGDDESELEEERRLCYVGMTRAKDRLTLTAARERMLRGEINLMKTSRFVREIPRELVELDRETRAVTEHENKKTTAEIFGRVMTMGREKKAPKFNLREFKVQKAEGLDYAEGDRVRHVKFGAGTVVGIVDGAKDYEVTVEFDTVGIKRMFASFAKLQKL